MHPDRDTTVSVKIVWRFYFAIHVVPFGLGVDAFCVMKWVSMRGMGNVSHQVFGLHT